MSIDFDGLDVWMRLSENDENFPNHSCKIAALEMAKSGHKIVLAMVVLDNYRCLGIIYEGMHYLSYDESSKNYCDITGAQFNGNFMGNHLPQVSVWSERELSVFFKIIDRDVSPERVF